MNRLMANKKEGIFFFIWNELFTYSKAEDIRTVDCGDKGTQQ